MIRVQIQPPPTDFDVLVRQPGMAFLRAVPRPRGRQWLGHEYWTKVLGELHEAYRGICAYSCHWIPHDTGAKSVDHFQPKSKYPRRAYDWNNYRLVAGTLNGRKGDDEEVIDPLEVVNGSFVLKFPSLLIKAAEHLPDEQKRQVNHTIVKLRLNDDATCLKSRFHWLKEFCRKEDLQFLRIHAPFIAYELERQDLVTTIKGIMSFPG